MTGVAQTIAEMITHSHMHIRCALGRCFEETGNETSKKEMWNQGLFLDFLRRGFHQAVSDGKRLC